MRTDTPIFFGALLSTDKLSRKIKIYVQLGLIKWMTTQSGEKDSSV